MATSSKPDKNDSRKTEKTGRRSDDPKTDRFPAFQKADRRVLHGLAGRGGQRRGRWEVKRRCWFCRYRRQFVVLVAWHGRWRKACPTCQIRFAQGVLKERR